MLTLSNKQIKLIRSLKQGKFRNREGMFVAEGQKIVEEIVASDYEIVMITATAACQDKIQLTGLPVYTATEKQIGMISSLSNPAGILAVVKKPVSKINRSILENELNLALDTIQDPGNLGTIIRTADWFGIRQVICSGDSADLYNPKVIQATMGSFLRVNVCYEDLPGLLAGYSQPVYGAMMEGTPVQDIGGTQTGIVVIGNESKGISPAVQQFVSGPVTIPRYGNGIDSLNAAVAAGIICSVLRTGYSK